MAAGKHFVKTWGTDILTQCGTSKSDTTSLVYFVQQYVTDWIKECSEDLELDQSSISTTSGYAEGTYSDMWFFPKALIEGTGGATSCNMGPIIADVTFDATGQCTAIDVTMANGQYFAGEVLQMASQRPTDQATPGWVDGTGAIEITVTTGTENKPNLAGSPYWETLSTTSWSRYKQWVFALNRRSPILDARHYWMFGNTTGSSSGSTTWYTENIYIMQGWQEQGRTRYAGTDSGYNVNVQTGQPSYTTGFYYNSTPGQEVFVFSDAFYNMNSIGLYHADTTDGYNGSDVMSDWGAIESYSTRALVRTVPDTSNSIGVYQLATDANVSASGYVKPWRTLECKNWVVAGGNENLVSTTQALGQAPWYSYSNASGTLAYKQIGRYFAARII